MKSTGNVISNVRGISSSKKLGMEASIAFNRATDFRTEPSEVTLNPRAEKDTGGLIDDLPMWMERACSRIFAYDKSGNVYKKESSAWTKHYTIPNSVGNGMAYFGEDQNLYLAQNKTITRLLEACTGNEYYPSFLESEGGEPTNTKSLDLEASSSEVVSVADAAGLSITGDLTLEAYVKPESLPATNGSMVLVSKWSENAKRSYKLDITTESNYFGNGADGALVISSNTTEAPIDSACTGTAGTPTLTATNTSFAADQMVLIHQSRGTNAGQCERAKIQSYTAGTITLTENLKGTYTSGAQVRVLPQYTNVTINSGITYTAKAWNGTVGGILAFIANGTVTVTGTITVAGKGFRGGATSSFVRYTFGYSGEGSTGASALQRTANGNGGGGGNHWDGRVSGGGGGGNGTIGSNGELSVGSDPGYNGLGGSVVGSSDLSSILFGGGGGASGMTDEGSPLSVAGGNGGGIIMIDGATVTISGSVTANGANGVSNTSHADSAGSGAGGGGSILIKTQTGTLGTSLVTANGGTGGSSGSYSGDGGNGGAGRIAIAYYSAYTGTTSPTINATQDLTLGSVDGYVLRFQVSTNGTDYESYTKSITPSTSSWKRYAVTFDASASTAEFFENATSLGTDVGALTAIHDNASKLAIGADYSAADAAQNFYDGLVDDVRIWNDVRTDSELVSYNDRVLVGNESGLVAYYRFESNIEDTTSGNYDLAHSGTATYSSDIPFSGLTTRTDQDVTGESNSAVAGEYTLETTISETDGKRIFFIPTRDPQKSIVVKIAAVGTGNWTLTVHDGLNREKAALTVATANLNTGYYEFIFTDEWRPVIGQTYHFHLTSTVADGKVNVKTGETTLGTGTVQYAWFTTHFQILVDDEYHPMKHFLNMIVIGNERYVATLEGGDIYNPHRLTLPAGYRVRCVGRWTDYAVFGLWRGTSITDYDEGKLVFWDGVSDTYNMIIDVPEGGINSMWGTGDTLYFYAGYTGQLMVYAGELKARKVMKIPEMDKNKYIEIAPGAMTMWQTYLTIGSNLLTNSTDVHQGVYTYGKSNESYPDSFSFDYPLSLGDQQSTSTKVGCVFPYGQDLYIGWKNGTVSGIDKISVTNDVYSTGTIEMLISDYGKISKIKNPVTLRADFLPLVSGQSVAIKVKHDRDTNWTTLKTQSTVGATDCYQSLNEGVKEIEVAVDLATTVSTGPTLTGISLETESNSTETDI